MKFQMAKIQKAVEARIQHHLRTSDIARRQMMLPLEESRIKDYCTEADGPNIHMVNSLSILGWPEFKLQDWYEEGQLHHRHPAIDHSSRLHPMYKAYPEYKYRDDHSPAPLYIPTERVLLQLMQAACYCTKEEQLAFSAPSSWAAAPAFIAHELDQLAKDGYELEDDGE